MQIHIKLFTLKNMKKIYTYRCTRWLKRIHKSIGSQLDTAFDKSCASLNDDANGKKD